MTKLLNVREVAERLGVSNTTAWKYVKAEKIKSIKLIREYRIDEKELEKFIKNSAYST